jgi:hypothetical protein
LAAGANRRSLLARLGRQDIADTIVGEPAAVMERAAILVEGKRLAVVEALGGNIVPNGTSGSGVRANSDPLR